MKTLKLKAIYSLVFIFSLASLTSCTSVKPYQKNRLNDADMVLSSRRVQKFEQSSQLYREGASGANGGKSGGGCGCN